MDNFRIDVTSEGSILKAMDLAFGRRHKAIGYAVRDAREGRRYSAEYCEKYPHMARDWEVDPKLRRLVFYWSMTQKAEDVSPLPFSLDAVGAADFVTRWLAEQDFGKEPDHDGDNGKGWRLYNEDWGHVDGHWSAFVAVSPAWAMYGK